MFSDKGLIYTVVCALRSQQRLSSRTTGMNSGEMNKTRPAVCVGFASTVSNPVAELVTWTLLGHFIYMLLELSWQWPLVSCFYSEGKLHILSLLGVGYKIWWQAVVI